MVFFYLATSSVSKTDMRGVFAAAITVQRSCIAWIPSVNEFTAIAPPGPILWSWSVVETVGVSVRSRLMKTASAASSFCITNDFRIAPRGNTVCPVTADVTIEGIYLITYLCPYKGAKEAIKVLFRKQNGDYHVAGSGVVSRSFSPNGDIVRR